MSPPLELTCQELVELVTEYLEGALATSERRRFEAHLRTCDGCTTYMEQMRGLLRALGGLTEMSMPEEARRELLQVFRDWKRSSR